MFLVGIVILAVIAEIKADEANCDKLGILVYEDIGCKPVKSKENDLCPSSYDCRHHHDFGSHCYYQGEKYNVRDYLESNKTELSCSGACYCNDEGSFTCAVLDCPEWLDGSNSNPDCVSTYNLNKCCRTGKLCKSAEEWNNAATCTVDGKEYKAGQRFYPKGTCSECICQKGFNGKYEAPYCRRKTCGVELKYRKEMEMHCAPVYRNESELCCPNFWACYDDELINPAETPSESTPSCIIGRQSLKLGEYIEKTIEKYGQRHNVHCECKLPPLLTCIIKGSDKITPA